MKLNRKIIIPAATLLIGFALAGSATSTIAWYQYSTKASVAYLGTSAGTSANLKVRIKKDNQAANEGWDTFISSEKVNAYLESKKIQPITAGAMAKDGALPEKFYSNPVCGYGPLEQWNEATAANYVQIPLQFKFVERDGSVDNEQNAIEKQAAKDLYLSDLLIKNDYSNSARLKRDLSSAIRVHFDSYSDEATDSHLYRLVSKDGSDMATVGKLDLDGDGKNDKSYNLANEDEHAAMYGFGGDETYLSGKGTEIMYGEKTGVDNSAQLQKSYAVSDDGTNGILNVKLGQTSNVDGKYLNVLVTIWIEGWQQLGKTSDDDANKSSIWDLVKTVDSAFDVGMQFEAKAIPANNNQNNG